MADNRFISRTCCDTTIAQYHTVDCKIKGPTGEVLWGEPAPQHNDGPSMHDLVIADMQSRKEFGLQKYGTILQAHNGRNALRDAYEEVLDLAVYLRQKLEEEDG
jgi:hypothetical protein